MQVLHQITCSTIEAFVRESDDLGGPANPECAQYWAGLQYVPTVPLDRQCDPLSPEYQAQQMALYREMTGHDYQERDHEFTPGVPIDSLLDAPNAYGFMEPHEYAKHCFAMGMLVHRLGLTSSHHVLELGSGWGFCQEFLAACGLKSTGIDVNPDFVCTSNQRLERLGFGARTQLKSFEDVDSRLGMYDVVMSYEAFHHAVDSLSLLRRCVTCLNPNGRVVLAAEPFNDYYSSWGLRLDPYSVYCIRKYGWFESGWSAEYIAFLFGMVGLDAEFIDMPITDLTRYMIGKEADAIKGFQLGLWHPVVKSSIIRDGEGFFCTPDTRFVVPHRCGARRAALTIDNYSLGSLQVEIRSGNGPITVTVPTGTSTVSLRWDFPMNERGEWIHLASETFCPAEQGINEDRRILGIRVGGLQYFKDEN